MHNVDIVSFMWNVYNNQLGAFSSSWGITNLGGITDSEQPCKHSCFVINSQDSKHPSQPKQWKENDSGLQGGPVEE